MLRVLSFLCLAVLAACQPIAETSDRAMGAGKRVATDTQRKWNSLFTYTPPKPDQLPQSRYCYQLSSDVVCYDSPQTGMTAKMTGYQDGANISAYQPGGGSLGMSGGDPTSGYNTPYIQSPGETSVDLKSSTVTQSPAAESAYQAGSVQVHEAVQAR
jgi:hypothetical protein